MKRFILMGIIAFLSISSAWSQTSAFKVLQDFEDVEYVCFDKAMLEAAFKASSPNANTDEALELIENLTFIILDKENKKASKKASSIFKKTIAKEYSIVLDLKEDESKTMIYVKELSDSKKDYVISYDDEENFIIVVVRGIISVEEAKNMLKIEIEQEFAD